MFVVAISGSGHLFLKALEQHQDQSLCRSYRQCGVPPDFTRIDRDLTGLALLLTEVGSFQSIVRFC